MKKYLGIVLMISVGLSIAACAPTNLISTGVSTAQSTKSTYSASDSLFVFRNLDTNTAVKVVAIFDGITTDDLRCKSTTDGITSCRLGDVALNTSTEAVRFTGKIASGTITWRTPSNQLRTLLVVPQQ